MAALLILSLLVAGCGGSGGHASPPRTVRGAGYSFSVADGWRTAAIAHGVTAHPSSGRGTLVSVMVFRLLKPYRPALFAQATKELDRVAAELAAKAGGKLTASETTTVDGRKIRAYRFTGRGAESRIGFVFDGRREYQLFCQAPAGKSDPDGACGLLFSSFRIR